MTTVQKTSRPRSTGRVTLADVAKAAEVSPITVSRALRGDRNVADELVRRVRAAAEALAYVPDPAAQSLASSRGRNVAVLVPLLTNRVFADLLEAVQNCLLPLGYQTLFGITHYQPLQLERLLQTYVAQRPAGLLITGFDLTDSSRRLLAETDVPRVHLMEMQEEPGTSCVGFSQRDAGFAMTRHLLERGRRRIVFAAAQLDPRVMQRVQGYRDCLQQAGLADPGLEWLDPQPSSIGLGARMFEQLMQGPLQADAIFFCNDDLAQGALLAAMRLGVDVPRQVAVAGFNDLEGSAQMWPPLTTVRTPRAAIGTQAAELLLRMMRGETGTTNCVDVGFELVPRGST